jgi:DNA-binding XRE family transcriptional regulator
MAPYGKRLVALRGNKSQEKVAKDIGISTSALGMYETEQRIPRDEIKIALARYFGTTVEAIFFAEE